MEFLANYGLFFLKILTLVVAILITVAGIAGITRKPKSHLEITPLNKHYEETKLRLLKEVAGKKSKQLKKETKLEKKEKKKQGDKPSLYVLDFQGDIKASQVEQLRQEVTALLSIARKEDKVLVRLESPGGAVNGYGLAASQLQRIRDKKISLTVCIDKMAASGGYLMACVANKIVAAPFAIIGSIGVVAQIPNFHRWLKKNNIDIELLTAGEYKRTLTLLGENTEKGRKKFQEDLEQIHQNFRQYVFENRQQIDINKVATGEHWLAKDAFDLRLVDSLKTSDEYIQERMDKYQIFKIHLPSKTSLITKLLKPAATVLHPWT